MNKIERFAQQMRDDAIHQESVFHICDSTLNAKKAADLLESQQTELADLRAKLAESEKREKAAVEDITFIHCAGKYGCEICLNNDLCKKQNIQIGKCPDFDWRGVQAEKE